MARYPNLREPWNELQVSSRRPKPSEQWWRSGWCEIDSWSPRQVLFDSFNPHKPYACGNRQRRHVKRPECLLLRHLTDLSKPYFHVDPPGRSNSPHYDARKHTSNDTRLGCISDAFTGFAWRYESSQWL